jgi:hypothetical protein
MIPGVQDRNGNIQTTTKDILRTFASFMWSKYGAIAVDEKSVNYMAKVGKRRYLQG